MSVISMVRDPNTSHDPCDIEQRDREAVQVIQRMLRRWGSANVLPESGTDEMRL